MKIRHGLPSGQQSKTENERWLQGSGSAVQGAAVDPDHMPPLPKLPRGTNKEIKKFYDAYAEKLHERGLLIDSDVPTLILQAACFSVAMKAFDQFDDEGLVVEDGRNRRAKNQAFTVFRGAVELYTRLADRTATHAAGRAQIAEQLKPRGTQLSLFETLNLVIGDAADGIGGDVIDIG